MNRQALMRFALRAVNDWSMVPVLRDALLENESTRVHLEYKIAFAEALSKSEARNYVVVMEPRMLSPTWRKRKGFDHPVFAVYGFNARRHGSLADLIAGLEEQLHEPIVPVYGARAGGRRAETR